MADSLATFYFGFLIVSIVLWIIYIFCSRLLSWMMGVSVEFGVGGWKCLRDVVVKFEKGAVESVSAGEIKLSLRQFLIKVRDPKLQVLICDLEVVVRSSTSTTDLQNSESQESRTTGRGKWMVVANIARFLSVSVTDIVVKVPKVIVEIKELKLDIDKDGGINPCLYLKLNVLQTSVHSCESSIMSGQLSNSSLERCSASQPSCAAFFCDELSFSSEFGHCREIGIVVRNVEIISGDVILNFDEDSFPKSKQSSASVQSDEVGTSTTAATLTKYRPSFPEKVSFSLSNLDVKYREHGLLAENHITGIELSLKSKCFEDTGESSRLDVQIDISEIHLFKKAESSILKISKVDVESFIDIPIQPDLPIKAEVDIKLGGTRCDLFMSRLQTWLCLYGEPHTLKKKKAADMETILWRGTVSTPEMTVMLYGLDDLPMYHFCSRPSLMAANNISSMDKTIHVELGELNLHLGVEPHTASILSYASEECKRLKYSVSLEISQFSFCLNKDLHKIELEFKRARSIYQEYMEEHKVCSKVTLFDMHDVKFVRRSGGTNEFDVCSLVSATDISLGWEPDVHLFFYELFLRLRSLVHAQRPKEDERDCDKDISTVEDVDKQKKEGSIFAIDVEMLTISAKVKKGVDIKLEVESLFSENVSIGVLLERIMLAFNGSRVFKTTRMQISRILTACDAVPWDWVVQALDLHVCLPYKLELRDIADSVEEMLEGLRVITVVETSKREESTSKFGRIRFCIRKLTADIEEEPMQGWLDEHYQLMKKEACELAVRLKFLEDVIHKETSDPLAIKKAREEIQKRSFQSYYQACKGLVPSEGSGACRKGFQAGFKPSSARTSLLSVCATNFDLSLKAVREDDAGLMEILKKLDPVCEEKDILFSRSNGSNVCLVIGSLVVQLRNYTLPLLSFTSGKCEGRIVQLRAQQADEEKCKSSGQPQISQDVFVGRWRKVKIFRPAGTSLPMKTYSDLPIQFKKGELSFGVGYEPAFANLSYAFSVALGAQQVVEEEQSLPWWDNMRNNVQGNITLSFAESKWVVLATTDPYESQDKFQIVTGFIGFQQSDGRACVNAKDFKIKLSSLESWNSQHYLKAPVATYSAAFFEAPVFDLEVVMDWDCKSENSSNVLDPFRSTPLSLWWNLSLTSPTMTLGAHDLAWMLKFVGMNSDPPNKLRSFSGRPRFGVLRVAIPINLSLDQVMTELMLRVDATPFVIKYMPWDSDDLAKGLTFNMAKLKYELCFSRGKQTYTFECKRDALDLVYQGLDLRELKAFINDDENHKRNGKHGDEGFILSSDNITIRRQAPKTDLERLLAWQEAERRNLEMKDVRSELENGSESDDDGYTAVIADNCQRVFVYGLKLLWTIDNRDLVRSFVGEMSKAFEPPKPSPSRQFTQRSILEENQKVSCPQGNFSSQPIEKSYDTPGEVEANDSEEEGTRHFMVNVIEPQFNLHSEEANGNFLLAAVSGRVLARSFHSIMRVGVEVIEQALGIGSFQIPDCIPEMTWTRMEFSLMLEHVQAHVSPTDLDQGVGLQWLPKISRNSPKGKRTAGALLERVFMPCNMYFRYTRHKGGTPDLKVKPLEEVSFNSRNIIATMTSRQFQVMMDVLNNLLLARLPEPQNSSLQYPIEEEDVEEEADEVVPYGVEEVELAKINLEEKEWERKLLLDDIRILSSFSDSLDDTHMEREGKLWMITSRRSILVNGLKQKILYAQKSRNAASASLRMVLQKVAQLQLMEKEKNKSPSYAMCISLQINKVLWSMIVDGKSFAEAEIIDMIYDFDRDYKDIGVARFTTKYFVVRNCLANAKSDILLSAWNPPPDWGKKVMLHVDAKQGAPQDGDCPLELELFQVEIYPLRIHLTETMYKMVWEYFFPEEEQDSQRGQEVLKISTTAGSKRVKKGLAAHESSVTTSHAIKDIEATRVNNGVQKSNTLNLRSSTSDPARELRRSSSFDKTWEETVAELVSVSSSIEQQEDFSKQKLKETKPVKSGRSSHEKKKDGKSQEKKKSLPKKMIKLHNIKISQVELLVTYEGSRLTVNELRLLMDTFHRVEFTGTWKKLFARVKKHIIWSVLKSITGIQGKKFSYKIRNKPEFIMDDLNLSDSDHLNLSSDSDQTGKYPATWFKRQSVGAGDGFVTSIRGLFNTQRRKAKAFVLKTMRGEAEDDFHGEWSNSDSDVESYPFARKLTITKAKRLIRRHSKKLRSRSERGSTSQQRESLPSSARETTAFESDDSSGSSSYEDFRE